jgi:hypothetical protein
LWGLFSLVLWRTTRTYRDFPWRSSRLMKRSFHHRLWRLPYTEVLVCHKQRVEVFHSNLSIERSWVPFRCWVSLFLTGFTSNWLLLYEPCVMVYNAVILTWVMWIFNVLTSARIVCSLWIASARSIPQEIVIFWKQIYD